MSSSSFPRSPAGSPPAAGHATLPKSLKRPSAAAAAPHGPLKKQQRQYSIYSTGSNPHPLRNASFPPEDKPNLSGLRSPSVDTDVAPSIATSVTGGGKRGKKRKSAAPEGSVKSAKMGNTGQRGDAESRGDGAEPEEEDEDDDGEGDTGLVVSAQDKDVMDKRQKLAMLHEAMDPVQQDRMNQYRIYSLNQARVRRIVNQTLSQSVPKAVVQTICFYTKSLIGQLIEDAIEIQRINELASREHPSPKPDVDASATAGHAKEPGATSSAVDATAVSGETSQSVDSSKAGTNTNASLLEGPEPGAKKSGSRAIEEPYIGPLLPDSLREGLRRIRRDSELGGVGLEGTSLGLGVPGARSAALGGQRLFR